MAISTIVSLPTPDTTEAEMIIMRRALWVYFKYFKKKALGHKTEDESIFNMLYEYYSKAQELTENEIENIIMRYGTEKAICELNGQSPKTSLGYGIYLTRLYYYIEFNRAIEQSQPPVEPEEAEKETTCVGALSRGQMY